MSSSNSEDRSVGKSRPIKNIPLFYIGIYKILTKHIKFFLGSLNKIADVIFNY